MISIVIESEFQHGFKVYSAHALKTIVKRSNDGVKFRHYWYHTPYFIDEMLAIEYCNAVLSFNPSYKGYEFKHVSSMTIFR